MKFDRNIYNEVCKSSLLVYSYTETFHCIVYKLRKLVFYFSTNINENDIQ